MKVTLYMDVHDWVTESGGVGFFAYSRPAVPKPTTATRYGFTVDVPDPRGESIPAEVTEAVEDAS
jgi:hypothetical protein